VKVVLAMQYYTKGTETEITHFFFAGAVKTASIFENMLYFKDEKNFTVYCSYLRALLLLLAHLPK